MKATMNDRDIFANNAMHAYCSRTVNVNMPLYRRLRFWLFGGETKYTCGNPDEIAAAAYGIADEMMKRSQS